MSNPVVQQRTIGARTIRVIDQQFDSNVVLMIWTMLRTLPYWRSDYDNEQTGAYRHLKHEWTHEQLAGHPLLKLLHATVERHIGDAYGAVAPALLRAHANEVPYGDVMFPHQDPTPGVTGLYFANPDWNEDWQGETIFYDGEEPVAAVAPRPGRIILFPADIVHRAGVPSRLCAGTRISVAFKYLTEGQPL